MQLQKKAECPMEGNCQVNNVIYKCDVTRPLLKKVYLGLAEGEWESRFYNYKLSFKKKEIFQQDHTLKLHVAFEKCFK